MSVMGEDPRGSGDLLLNHAQYAFVLDENKGTISTYVGPNRQAISQNDRPVVFNKQSGEFDQANIARATQSFTKADEGSYIVLTNPTVEESKAHPASATSSQLPDLNYGRKVNIPSIQLKAGDVIELREKSRKIVSVNDSLEAVVRRGIPQWLELDRDAFKGILKGLPSREDITTPIQEQLIVELYSK